MTTVTQITRAEQGPPGPAGVAGVPGPNSGRTTCTTVYLATDGDDLADGITPANAVGSISAALALLGTKRGAIQLIAPSAENYFAIPAAGIVLAYEGQLLLGDGFGTKIDSTGLTGGAVITVGRSRCVVRDLYVANVPANKVGVRVSIVSGSSNEDSRIENILVLANGTGAVAYGIGDDTNNDVSELMIVGCSSGGNYATSVHMIVGNHTTGNVLDIVNIGGNSQGNQYGLVLDGGGIVSTGLSFQSSVEADVWFKATALGACVIRGGRSENAKRFVKSTFGTQSTAVCLVADYSALNLQNTDGIGVQVEDGPITFDNVSLQGASGGCPQYWATGSRFADDDTLSTISLRECASDHPHPTKSPWSRPGKNIRSTGMRWTADASEQMQTRRNPTCNVRRQNVTTAAAYSLDPAAFDAIEVRLAASAGVFTLASGIVGQELTITFEQDGVGGWAYTWPVNVAWDGGSPPSNVTTRRNRQKVRLAWAGSYWEQRGSVTNTVPPTPVSAPFSDSFSTGYPFSLAAPWEHLPGGGSIGVSGGVAYCTSVGYVGDTDSGDGGLMAFGGGAAAVRESGIGNATITATFVWQSAETIIARYLDEQTFTSFWMRNLAGDAGVYITFHARGASLPWGHVVTGSGVPFVAGNTYVLVVALNSTGATITVNGGAPHAITWGAAPYDTVNAKYGDLTKHGFVLTTRSTAWCTDFTVA